MSAQRHIALLRGINVGGKNKLPMARLKEIFERLGCEQITTYIQSGNVIFEPGSRPIETLAEDVGREIEKDFGYKIPVVLRTAADLRRVAENNPYLDRADEPKFLHVAFLADEPAEEGLAALDPNHAPPDRFTVVEQEIYLWYPNGTARSKLTNAYFDSRLKTVSTARNWRTTLKLLELSGG